MNRIYKVIWSKVKNQYVVVSELAHRDGKKNNSASKSVRIMLVVLSLAAGIGFMPVYAEEPLKPEVRNAVVDGITIIENENMDNEIADETTGDNAVIIGKNNTVKNNRQDNPITVNDSVVSGVNHEVSVNIDGVAAYGNGIKLTNWTDETSITDSVFLGSDIQLQTMNNINGITAVGTKLNVSGSTDQSGLIMGNNIQTGSYSSGSTIIGNNLKLSNIGANSIIIANNSDSDDSAILAGRQDKAIVIGTDNKINVSMTNKRNGVNRIIGNDNSIDKDTEGLNPTSLFIVGSDNLVKGNVTNSFIFGDQNKAYGTPDNSDNVYNVVIGQNNTLGDELNRTHIDNAILVGSNSTVGATGGVAIGERAEVYSERGIAIGQGAKVSADSAYSTALGTWSQVQESDIKTSYKANGEWDYRADASDLSTYTSHDGQTGVVSVGRTGLYTRRITNVERGIIGRNSTDAVNGSQLRNYAVHDGDMTLSDDGTLTMKWTDDYKIGTGWTSSVEGIASQDWVTQQINENGGGDWTLTTNGGTMEYEKTTIGKDSVVDFSGAKDASNNNHQNINVTQEQTGNGTNVTFDLNDKVILGTGDSQITIDATDNNGIFAIGESSALGGTTGVFMNAAGQANFGAIKFNQDTKYTPAGQEEQHSSTVTGLSNTYWDADDPEIGGGRAATEEQLKAAISQVEAGAYSGWNVSGGDSQFASVDKEHNKVHFDGAVRNEGQENEHQNINVSQAENADKNGYDLTFDLNDKVILGTGDSQITIDANNGTFAIGADSTLEGTTGVFMNAAGQANFGAIQFNQDTKYTPAGQQEQHSSTITGLSNTYWDADDPKIGGGRAATEEQLKQAVEDVQTDIEENAYGGWNISANGEQPGVHVDSNGTIDFSSADNAESGKNISIIQDGKGNLTFDLSDRILLGDNISPQNQILLDGNMGSMFVGGLNGVTISRNPAYDNGYIIDGLANIEWTYDNYKAGVYAGSHKAATEAQLQDAFGYLDDKINNIDINIGGDDNIGVDKTEGTGSGTGTGGSTGSGSADAPKFDFDISMNDNPTFGGHTDGKPGHDANGSVTVVGTGEDGTSHKVVIDGETGLASGLSNTDWDWNKYEEGGYQTSNAATESQLHGAMEGTVQYDRDEDGNVDKTNVTLNKGGDSVTIHNVAAGTADTDAVNVSQLNEAWDQINNNTTAITNIGNKVGELDSRIDEVGAGAAALAALHPLDFDPDDKWDFSAGYGNYRGESAVAFGAFYRPNEDTMFSVGGTVGNDDNMVNAGVSFKIGQGNGVSTSRVAMAKEIKDLRKELEAMKSAMLDVNAGRRLDTSKLQLFPDVPQNHWAYEYVATLAGNGVIEGYPDGNFDGARPMTRYEFAAMLYRAMLNGAKLSDKILTEFAPELERFTVDVVHKDKDGNPTVERVRVVKK